MLAPDAQSLRGAVAALESQGYAPRAPVQFGDFVDAELRRSWQREKGMVVLSDSKARHPATEVDQFLEPPFDFESAWGRSATMNLGPGVSARFLSPADLRAMKRAVARPVDQLDLEALARLHPEDDA